MTRTLAERIVDLAREQVGVTEATGKNDGIPSTRYMGGRQEPWCAHMCAWVYETLGAPLPGNNAPTPEKRRRIGLVSTMLDEARIAGWALPPSAEPQPGDIGVVADRTGSDRAEVGRPQWHCFVVDHLVAQLVHTIEGNMPRSVRALKRARHSPKIVAWIRHPQANEPWPPPAPEEA
jgi:hypothetical protein